MKNERLGHKKKDVREGIAFPSEDYRFVVFKDRQPFLDRKDDAERLFHEEIEIKYFVEGRVTLQIGNELIEAEAGDIVIINPNEFHSTIDIGDAGGRYHLMMMSLDFFRDTGIGVLDLKNLLLDRGVSFSHVIRGNRAICHILNELIDEYGKDDSYSKMTVQGFLLSLFGILIKDYTAKREDSSDPVADFRHYDSIEPALRKIRYSYAEKLTLDELAELCNVSKCHFCRLFKATTGMTPMEFASKGKKLG